MSVCLFVCQCFIVIPYELLHLLVVTLFVKHPWLHQVWEMKFSFFSSKMVSHKEPKVSPCKQLMVLWYPTTILGVILALTQIQNQA